MTRQTTRRAGTRSAVRVFLLAALLLGLAPAGVGRAGAVPDDASAAATGRIGSRGGSVSGAGVTLRLPRDAVPGPTRVRVATATVPASGGFRPVQGFTVTGTAVSSGAVVTRFGAPARLAVPVGATGGADLDRLRVASLDADRRWSVLPTNRAGRTLRAIVDGPGTYAVVDAGRAALSADHNVTALIDDSSLSAGYGEVDAPLVLPDGTKQFRLRFQVTNTGGAARTVTPRLEYRPVGGGAWTAVPAKPVKGLAFAADREWVRRPGPRGGSTVSGTSTGIPVSAFRIPGPAGVPAVAAPDPETTAPSGTAPTAPGGSSGPGEPGGSSGPGGSTGPGTPSGTGAPTGPDPGTTPAGPSPQPSPEQPSPPPSSVGLTPPPSGAAPAAVPLAARPASGALRGLRGALVVLRASVPVRAVPGRRSMGANPGAALALPPGTATEQEFTVRITADARRDSRYEFRLTDGGATLAGAVARVGVAARAPARLSPRQRGGVPVDTAAPRRRAATTSTGSAATVATTGTVALTLTALRVPDAALPGNLLDSLAVRPAAVVRPLLADPLPDTMNGVHGPYSVTSDQCGTCHRTHVTTSQNLLVRTAPQSTLCFTCHDGTGSASNVQAAYADATIPANNPAAREYYGHDATLSTGHTSAASDEFGGVSNRHSECADCHNAHRGSPAPGGATPGGWAASGALTGVSGVAVVNGAAGTAPAYTPLNGTDAPVTLEYQLCLKCHSGYTVLPSNAGFAPSRHLLDKGVEFNPANPSYHPVEAAGTNQTPAMAASLAGTSPYKLWNFTTGSTVRCTNCHASSSAYDPADPVPPGGDLPTHRSAARGILLQPYRDRVLKAGPEPYDAADFALCYVCHAEEPFVDESSTATNFRLHAMHLSDIHDEGSGGTDIDTAGAGQGNALCAECHFRNHSTAYPAGPQDINGTRLVNFAPDVQPYNGVLSWSGGTCTLVCHGQQHDRLPY